MITEQEAVDAVVIELIRDHGPFTASELAEMFGTSRWAIKSVIQRALVKIRRQLPKELSMEDVCHLTESKQ